MDAKKIGQRLRALRGDKHLGEVAAAVGVQRTAMVNYELGLRIPRDEIKIKIAGYYGVGIEDLFYNEEFTKREVG